MVQTDPGIDTCLTTGPSPSNFSSFFSPLKKSQILKGDTYIFNLKIDLEKQRKRWDKKGRKLAYTILHREINHELDYQYYFKKKHNQHNRFPFSFIKTRYIFK